MTRACSVSGCERPHFGRGYCSKHYYRWANYGDPHKTKTAPTGEPLAWLKGLVGANLQECIIWPFGCMPGGYGALFYNGKNDRAHRVMCLLAHGKPEFEDACALHSCDRGHEGCVNPNHLRWGTRAENVRDMVAAGNQAHGHQHGRSKLTEGDVLEIVRHGRRGESYANIASEMGTTKPNISTIMTGRSWSWLTGIDPRAAR